MEQLSLFEEVVTVSPNTGFTEQLPSVKPAGETIRGIIDSIKEAYIDQSNGRPWVVTTSFGKDSTLLCLCVWIALLEIPAIRRNRKVFFISSDTGLEHPNLTKYVHKSIQMMNTSAAEQGLDCVEALLVEPDPKERFARKVIGHGVVMPTPKSPFRWCTDDWKIAPAERFIKQLLKRFGEVCVMTGVRHAESVKRSTSISKHGNKEMFIFPKVKVTKEKNGKETRAIVRGRFESHPIAHVQDNELWDYLMQYSRFPWKGRFYEMYSFYSDQGECPMQVQEIKSTCGSSRNGCTLCLMVKEDGMLDHFKSKNESWAFPISELRTIMIRMIYDSRFREPLRKRRIINLDTRNVFTGQSYSSQDQLDLFDDYERKDEIIYDPLEAGGLPAFPDLALGSFSLEARIFLLKNVLYFQREAGMVFVTDEDIEYIKSVWQEEHGWTGSDSDIAPEYIPYRGALVLDAQYNVNYNETSIANLVVDSRYYAAEQRGLYVKDMTPFKILNPTTCEDYQFIYYVNTDFGGSERDIWSTFEKAKRVKGYALPFIWQPVTASSVEQGRRVFWNNVTVIVCRPEVRSLNDAREFVEKYIAAGSNVVEPEKPDWEKIYWSLLKAKSWDDARRFVLSTGDEPSHVPESIKDYTHLLDEEILLASIIASSTANRDLFQITPEVAMEACLVSDCWDKVFNVLTSDCETIQAGRSRLFDKGYSPLVVPYGIKAKFEVSDQELYWNFQIKRNGERTVIDTLACFEQSLTNDLPFQLPLKVNKRRLELESDIVEAVCSYA